MPRIPPEKAAKIRQLYNDADLPEWLGGRFTMAELAAAFKISPASVRKILNGPKPEAPDAPLSVPEVARLLKVSPATVRGWIRAGSLISSDIGAKRSRFVVTKEALSAFLKSREPEPTKKRSKPARRSGFKRY